MYSKFSKSYKKNLSKIFPELQHNHIKIIDGMNRSILAHPFDSNFSTKKNEFKFLINSYGGSFTSALIKYLNPKYENYTNHMWYHLELKHKISPPVDISHNFKAIYIYGDPRDALISIYSRKLQNIHYLNTFQKKKKLPKTIEAFLDDEVDYFKFLEHHINWTKKSYCKRNFEILVIDYRKIWNYKKEILDFLELPNEMLHAFPKKMERKSSYKKLSSNYQKKINLIFKKLLNIIEKTPDFIVI